MLLPSLVHFSSDTSCPYGKITTFDDTHSYQSSLRHRSYSNKPNKIYFIFFAFFLEFIWNLQAIAENKHKIKEKSPLNSPTDQWAPLVSGTKQRRGG